MRLKLAAIALGIVVVASAFGASAFTTATVERNANINVTADDSGLIGLTTPTDTAFINDNSGKLSIDVSSTNSDGVNQESTLEIGSQSSPAFNITNNFPSSRDLNVQYTLDSDDGTTSENIKFHVYNSTGTTVATVTEENSSATTIANADSGASYAVAIKINTTGLTSSDDLSGTLNVTA